MLKIPPKKNPIKKQIIEYASTFWFTLMNRMKKSSKNSEKTNILYFNIL
jgi:hypothetical protein